MSGVYQVCLLESLEGGLKSAIGYQDPSVEKKLRVFFVQELLRYQEEHPHTQAWNDPNHPYIEAGSPGRAVETFAARRKLIGKFRCVVMHVDVAEGVEPPLFLIEGESQFVWKALVDYKPVIGSDDPETWR